MNFLDTIFKRMQAAGETPVLQEVRDGRLLPASGFELMATVRAARGWLARAGLRRGDRCALLAPNSIAWAVVDLALMAEGIIVVPLYARQAPAELVRMILDAHVALILCGDESLRSAITAAWAELANRGLETFEIRNPQGRGPQRAAVCALGWESAIRNSNDPQSAIRNSNAPAPPMRLLGEAIKGDNDATDPGLRPQQLADSDPVTIIYTSGTSGEPKGVVLTAGNLNHMLDCTTMRLDQLMAVYGANQPRPERVFHYAPFCFAASWMLLLSCFSRNALLTLSTDLTKLADEIKIVAPMYFLNVPALLERVKSGTEAQIAKRGGLAAGIFNRALGASVAGRNGAALLDRLCLAIARHLIFPAIRGKISPRLLALICGSAPLAPGTQQFFEALGIPVLQAYGLTETTAICTLDQPGRVTPGRVGPAVPGVEMRLDENGEIVVRGPNIFAGYWRRPEQTAATFRDGWFMTGDQGEVDANGNWKIVGRVKDLIVLSSGHKVPPEPLEDALRQMIAGAQQVVLVGTSRSFLSAIVTGNGVQPADVQNALDAFNPQLPHYKRIHAFHIEREPFTIENGLLTANGKLKRDAIAASLKQQIDALYGASGKEKDV